MSSAVSCVGLACDVLVGANRLYRNSGAKAVLRRGAPGVVVPAAFTRQKRGGGRPGSRELRRVQCPKGQNVLVPPRLSHAGRNPADFAPMTSHGLPETSHTRPGWVFTVRKKWG